MTLREKHFIVLGGIVLIGMAGSHWLLGTAQAERRPRVVRQRFDADAFQPQQIVKPFPPIVDPPHVPAREIGQQVQPTDLVLGISIDGVSRAYPINMLTGPSREIFNDTLGTHAIAATW